MKYKEVVERLLKVQEKSINCMGTKRYETCVWNKKARYDKAGTTLMNEAELSGICVKCLIKNLEEVLEEM